MKKIQGFGGGGGGKGGGGGGSARVAVESPDSLRSKAFARVLDLICEGEIEGLVDGAKSVYLDETPLQNADGSYNFQGLELTSRNGTQWQQYIPGFPAVESETYVGVEVKASAAVTRQITNPNLDAVRVRISTPQLTSQNTQNGDISGTSVSYRFEIQSNGGGFKPVLLRRETFALYDASGVWKTPQAISSATVNIQWDGNNDQRVGYQIQRRAKDSGAAWTVVYTGEFVGSIYDPNPAVSYPFFWGFWGWEFGYAEEVSHVNPEPRSYSFSENLTEGNYEYRVVKTSGDDPIYISSATGYGGVGYDTITGKTTSKYERTYRIDLTGEAPWDIRVVRTTADSTSTALQNKTFWESYTEIVDAKLRYPNSALVGLKIDSSQFNSIPTRAYDVKMLKVKVPTNYDPITRAYSGIWNGSFKVAWTDNPAWCFYDLLTNDRYGLGGLIDDAQVDKWALYTVARYCDELVPDGFGGQEPRFTCNMYIQSRNDAYKVMQDMASIFRGMIYWQSGSLTVSQDSPSDPVYLYTPANVIEGVFNYQGSSAKARHTVALVTWNDPDDFYRQKVEFVEDPSGIARYGIVQTEITAIGCTSRGQANRVGRWLLYSEQSESEVVSFKTGIEGAVCRPGQIISVADPIRGGARRGGRVASATTTAITLDSAVTLTGSGHTLSVLLPNGTVEKKTISSVSGAVVTLSSALSVAPASGAVWVIESPNLQTQLFRVVSVVEAEDGIEISGLAHNPSKFAAIEQGLALQPRQITSLTTKPNPPSIGTVTEYLYNALTDVKVMALFSWIPPDSPGVTYAGTYTVGNNNPVNFTSSSASLQLSDAQPGDYSISVQSVSPIGAKSVPYTFLKSVLGKTAAPADVTGLQMTVQGETGVLQWDLHPDLDVRIGGQVSIRYSEDIVAARWSASIPVGSFPGSTTSGAVPLRAGTYLVKATDSSGINSINARSVVTDAPNIVQFNAVATSTQEPTFAGAKTGTVAVNSRLVLDNAIYMDSIANFDAYTDTLDGGLVESGEYEFNNYVDTGAVYTSRVTSTFNVLSYSVSNVVDQWGLIDGLGSIDEGIYALDFVDSWEDWDVIVNFDVTTDTDDSLLEIFISTTNDNPSGSAAWSDWRVFYIGDYTARAFKFKVRLNRGVDGNKQVALTNLGVTVDVPDRIESANNVPVPSGGLTVTFANSFFATPAIAVTAENMATGDYYIITAKSASGFTIQFKNTAGTGVARTMDWIAKGFGYQN